MLGVFVNVITVIAGSCVGLLFKKGIPEKVSKAAMTGLGACTLYIGISGSLCGENVLILIGSVVLGAICGTLLDIGVYAIGFACMMMGYQFDEIQSKRHQEGRENGCASPL